MNKKIPLLTRFFTCLVLCFYSLNLSAAESPWVFTSKVPSKNEMISIANKEVCRPLPKKLVTVSCAKYKQGYVCPGENAAQVVITTHVSKKSCSQALKKARRLLAKK